MILPTSATAEDGVPATNTSFLLEKISSLHVFKLRLPYKLQKAIQAHNESKQDPSPDSCETRVEPYQKGSIVEYSCDPKIDQTRTHAYRSELS